jgi:sugar phosphate isomerase/epimerase
MADTWKAIGKWVVDTHFKDSRPDSTERLAYRYTLMGEGDVPNLEALQILKDNGFRGYLCLEWEKAWHPYLPDAHTAFPQYVQSMRDYLAQLK